MAVTRKQVLRTTTGLSALLLAAALWWWFGDAGRGATSGFFRTADQQARVMLQQGDVAAAAQRFRNPQWQAASLYRAGDFKQAAGVYAGLPGSEAVLFNHGNALLMSGSYDAAIERYDAALQQRPGWQAAVTNRSIAVGRRDRIHHEGADMTGGQMEADKGFRFDKGPPKDQPQQPPAEGEGPVEGGMQDIWLRKVQTKPGDFLRAKFAYQQATPIKHPEEPPSIKGSE
ncbi:MAG: hypothetical protein ABFR19_05165 [Pseudomonadota bacterium]